MSGNPYTPAQTCKPHPTKGEAPDRYELSSASSEPINALEGFNVSNHTEVAPSRAITVPFRGADLYVVERDGQPYTPMRPIVEGMGLTWPSQFRKLAANKVRWGISIMETPLQGVSDSETPFGGVQKMLAMPLRKLPGWLASIESGKVKDPEARSRVIQYQNECDDVLWRYWNEGIAINPRAAYSVNPGDVLTKEEADTLRQMVEGMAKKLTSDTAVQGKFIMQAWSKLKAHFHVSYRQIPRNELTEALSIVNRHTVEWELVDDLPAAQPMSDADRLKGAYELATEVAAAASRAVFNAVLENRAVGLNERWMFGIGIPARDGVAKPWAQPVHRDAMVVSMAELPVRLLEPGGMLLSNTELANLAAACNQRLARRLCAPASA